MLLVLFTSCAQQESTITDDRFHIRVVDLKKEKMRLYWKDRNGQTIKTFENLKTQLDKNGEHLIYAMNAGMFLKDFSPQGLFIEKQIVKNKMDTITSGYGNFYLQPNGVFGITTDGNAVIQTSALIQLNNLEFATQSGPMLVINNQLHPAFNKGSKNVHLRNAVGILPDGIVLLVISKEKINFYDLATFFKNQGCKNALYLDGFVSRVYDEELRIEHMDGNFGVMIGISKH